LNAAMASKEALEKAREVDLQAAKAFQLR